MWFADVGLALALLSLVAVISVAGLAWLAHRTGWSFPRVQRAVWIGGTVSSSLLVAQASVVDLVEDANGSPGVDHPVLNWFIAHRVGWATALAKLLAALGGAVVLTVVTSVTVLLLLRSRRRWQAAVVGMAGLGSALLVSGFKQLYARDRPATAVQLIFYDTHALPSGHALSSTVVLGMVAAVVVRAARSRVVRVTTVFSVTVLVLLIGVSRLYLAAHWLTDVLAGWLLGGAWLAVAVTALVLARRQDERVAEARLGGRGVPATR